MNTTQYASQPLNPEDLVTFDTTWYNMMNMAMLIFSATLIVHISNAYRAFRMYTKHPSHHLFIMNVVETFCGVSCHLCRVSDYFFVTDCHFKGYYNGVFYYVSTALVTGIYCLRCYRVSPLKFIYAFIMVGFHVAKFASEVDYSLGLDAKVGTFRECATTPGGISFPFLIFTEVYMNAVMLVWWAAAIIYLVRKKSDTLKNLLEGEGAGYTMVSNIVTIVLFTMVIQNVTLNLNPEVLIQTKWAIESKLCVQQMHTYHLKLTQESNEQSSQGSSGPRSGRRKVHDLPFWSWGSTSKDIKSGESKKTNEIHSVA
ncbi:hypothetical protein K7432_009204 [Basidiobolus ranarum]|uniref:Uncharacterized protein n=1 Tax=Basidiobolus ranarum TaxID=34480 RepID=A0ABR2VY68_9FUNG